MLRVATALPLHITADGGWDVDAARNCPAAAPGEAFLVGPTADDALVFAPAFDRAFHAIHYFEVEIIEQAAGRDIHLV